MSPTRGRVARRHRYDDGGGSTSGYFAGGGVIPPAGPVLVQAASGVDSSTATPGATFASPPTVGNLLVTVLGAAGGPVTVVPPGYTVVPGLPVTAVGDGVTGRYLSIAYKVAGVAEPSLVTWTFGAAVLTAVCVLEFANMPAGGVVDGVSPQSFSAVTVLNLPLGPTPVPSGAASVVVAGCVIATRTGQAFDNGFALENTDGIRCMTGVKILAAAAAQSTTPSWVVGGANTAAGIMVIFR